MGKLRDFLLSVLAYQNQSLRLKHLAGMFGISDSNYTTDEMIIYSEI